MNCIHELVNGGVAAKEKRSIFFAKVKEPAVRADRGANRIKGSLEVWARWFSPDRFGQNYDCLVDCLISQVHPSELTKKP